ncbi:MAG: LrgB family protein [Prevotellaceae bacterium]|jgi:predicted murein hydrolase (TIGR00659 family)|nr:LrgB family protein [Prevotellaceae bacterium]
MKIINTEIFMLLLTIGSFLLGTIIFKKTKISFFQPLVIALCIIIPFLLLTGIDFESYFEHTQPLNFMLGPSVVALGYVLYEQVSHLKGNILSMLAAIFTGCVVGIGSVVLLAKLFGADQVIVASLAPKSVTMPIALSLSDFYGGKPSLTAAFVAICGIFGSWLGPFFLRIIGIKSRIARGLAMGSASHALGTARAMEIGAVEGALGGLAIGIMGLLTALLMPFFKELF